jgi:hypothetical protein
MVNVLFLLIPHNICTNTIIYNVTMLALKKASSDSLRNFFPGVCLNVKMTVLLAEKTLYNDHLLYKDSTTIINTNIV